MDTQSEQECLNYCKEHIEEYRKADVNGKRTIHNDCEGYCKNKGIVGVQFDMLWNRASLGF